MRLHIYTMRLKLRSSAKLIVHETSVVRIALLLCRLRCCGSCTCGTGRCHCTEKSAALSVYITSDIDILGSDNNDEVGNLHEVTGQCIAGTVRKVYDTLCCVDIQSLDIEKDGALGQQCICDLACLIKSAGLDNANLHACTTDSRCAATLLSNRHCSCTLTRGICIAVIHRGRTTLFVIIFLIVITFERNRTSRGSATIVYIIVFVIIDHVIIFVIIFTVISALETID